MNAENRVVLDKERERLAYVFGSLGWDRATEILHELEQRLLAQERAEQNNKKGSSASGN